MQQNVINIKLKGKANQQKQTAYIGVPLSLHSEHHCTKISTRSGFQLGFC